MDRKHVVWKRENTEPQFLLEHEPQIKVLRPITEGNDSAAAVLKDFFLAKILLQNKIFLF